MDNMISVKTDEKCEGCSYVMLESCRYSGMTMKKLYSEDVRCLNHRAPVEWYVKKLT